MFGKIMNNYYYGKSGKGDYNKEDLPRNRWQLFWEMLKIRFSGLMRLNLMYMIIWLPAMIVLMLASMSLLTGLSGTVTEDATTTAVVESADSAAVEAAAADPAAAMSLDDLLKSLSMSTLLLLIPCIAITGPCTAGVCYVTRNWARDEHAFIWSDFKDAVKENWKQSLVISLITSVIPIVLYVCWTFYGQMAAQNGFMIVPQVLTLMVGLIWCLGLTFFYPLIVSYKLKMKDVLRNGILLGIARLPQTIGVRLLHTVPTVIALVAAYFFNPAWAVIGLFLYYLVIGYTLSRFVTASYTNAVFDKYINSRMEGVQVNRGINTEADDDDEDEDEPRDGAPQA